MRARLSQLLRSVSSSRAAAAIACRCASDGSGKEEGFEVGCIEDRRYTSQGSMAGRLVCHCSEEELLCWYVLMNRVIGLVCIQFHFHLFDQTIDFCR